MTTFTAGQHSGHTFTGRAIGSCGACGSGIATEGVGAGTSGTCPHCGACVRLHLVYGEHSDIPCDSRCMGAVSEVCQCACGGQNHGKWMMRIDLVPVFEQEKARAAQDRRRTAHAAREARKRQTAEERAAAGRADLVAAYPVLAAFETDEYAGLLSTFMDDMRRAFNRGDMTPRQAEAACDAIRRDRDRAEQERQRAERRAVLLAAGVRAPTGRVEFTATILRVKVDEQPAGWRMAVVHKVRVRTAEGWEAWGTLPRSIEPEGSTRTVETWETWRKSLVGREITLTATMKPAADDPLFAYWSRPTGATLHPAPSGDPADAPTAAPFVSGWTSVVA